MSKGKKIECELHRSKDGLFWTCSRLGLKEHFGKGLRPGQSRKLILMQTKHGIQLERAEK